MLKSHVTMTNAVYDEVFICASLMVQPETSKTPVAVDYLQHVNANVRFNYLRLA